MERLIPPEWFHQLPIPALLLLAGVSMVLLVKGAEWLVEGAAGLAYRLGMPKVIVGATIVSLGTTSPECAVSVMAAWGGEPGLALGNAVGSIIADTGLIFGLGCLLAVLPADRFVLARQGWVQFGSAALLAVLCYGSWARQGPDAMLGRWVGLLLLGLLCVYMAVSVRWSRHHPRGAPFQASDGEGQLSRRSPLGLAGLVAVGLALVVVGSHVLIEAVSEMARQLSVPEVVIAATLVAFGTSLPELVVGITSLRRGHPELLVGNVIGADILNVLFVIGASAAAAPLPMLDPDARIPEIFLQVHLPTMLGVLILFRLFIHRAVADGRFRRWMGWPLVLAYAGYVVVQYAVS
ncbi:MAG: sodium:calcium antiporter [Acidobacteriota bacterium]